MRRAVTNGRVTAVLILLPPALILFTLFVILPLGECGWYYSFFNWNGYGEPADFVGLRKLRTGLEPFGLSASVRNTVRSSLVSLW